MLLDPATATVERLSVPGPLNSVVAWTSDGSALLLHSDWGATIQYWGERHPAEWRTVTVDDGSGGGTVNATLDQLDLGWRDGDWWREDGSRLQMCDMAVRQECRGLPNGSVVVETPDGTLTPWYRDELAPDDVVDAVFGGTGLWILLDRRSDGRQVALARVATPGDARTVATWDAGASPVGQGSTEGVAPDDPLVVAGSRLIDTRTGIATPVDGSFLGFVLSTIADTWPGGAFQAAGPVASALPPSTAYPTLRPLELVLAEQLASGDRLMWRQEQAAVDGPAASPSRVEIGPIELESGLGVFLWCSGPSDVLVTMAGPADQDTDPVPLTPLLSRCLDPEEVAGGYAPAATVDGPVRFSVTSTPDTDWQLVIFDPAPKS